MGKDTLTAAIALSRMKGIAAVVAVVALALAVCGVLARFGAKSVSRAMTSGDSTMEGGQDALVGRRIAGAFADLRDTGVGHKPDLGVVLGASAVAFDIDPESLTAATGPGIASRWLTLSANGANASDLRGLADLLKASNLPVKLVVLAVNPLMLAQSDHYLSDSTHFDTRAFKDELRARRLTSAKLELAALFQVELNRVFPERLRIGHHARVLATRFKHRLFAAIGQGAEAIYAPDPGAWISALPVAENDQKQENGNRDVGVMARELQEGPVREQGEIKDRGWFNAASYSVDSPNSQALAETIRDFRARGIEVCVLFIPEQGGLRRHTPAVAVECLNETLKRAYRANPPAIIDLRSAIDDANFKDGVHLKKEGRGQATQKLAEALRSRSS
jgi:hypothetical protein